MAPVSLLRPGVIKQHKLKNQMLVLLLYKIGPVTLYHT